MITSTTTNIDIRHFHLFCGMGAGARGFNQGEARVGTLQGRFRCIGGVDVDPAAVKDFQRMAGAPATVLDLFDREQYRAFHGKEPPADWREATPQDIQRAAGFERPMIAFTSAPCKGFSGLLPQAMSKSDKYQALNALTVRGMWLMLEAWADDPPEMVIFENVPLILTRGRELLDRIVALLRAYGYATAETVHDCGHLGGLAQSRKRFLLVARHVEKVAPLLYQPDRKPLRGVGEVIGKLPVPTAAAGEMHRIPALAWKTWLRLAFVEAGSDWRSLNRLAVEDGVLRDFLIVPEMRRGALGVRAWDETAGTITGNARPATGNFSVADPRFNASKHWNDGNQYGVHQWNDTCGTISGGTASGQGAYAVADARMGPAGQGTLYRIVPREEVMQLASLQVLSAQENCVADPRPKGEIFGKYAVTRWDEASGTILSGSTSGQGAYAVADPRSGLDAKRDAYVTGGHYGVIPWSESCGAVSAAACHDNGRWSVADPRMPGADDKLVAVIRSLDGTFHRPFTTLELAALQSLFDPEDPDDIAAFGMDGTSDSAWRERIGNAVPSAAARAIASEMGRTLLLAWSGETFALSAAPIWVRPVAAGIAVASTG